MVKYREQQLSQTLAALADPTRRAIVDRLSRADCTISQLAGPFDISLPAVSKHIQVLERAGLLRLSRRGRSRRCRLVARPMRQAIDWMSRYREFWENRLDALAELVETDDRDPEEE